MAFLVKVYLQQNELLEKINQGECYRMINGTLDKCLIYWSDVAKFRSGEANGFEWRNGSENTSVVQVPE